MEPTCTESGPVQKPKLTMRPPVVVPLLHSPTGPSAISMPAPQSASDNRTVDKTPTVRTAAEGLGMTPPTLRSTDSAPSFASFNERKLASPPAMPQPTLRTSTPPTPPLVPTVSPSTPPQQPLLPTPSTSVAPTMVPLLQSPTPKPPTHTLPPTQRPQQGHQVVPTPSLFSVHPSLPPALLHTHHLPTPTPSQAAPDHLQSSGPHSQNWLEFMPVRSQPLRYSDL